MKIILTCLVSLIVLLTQGQSLESGIEFKLVFQGQALELDRNYFSEKLQDSIRFETVRFYVSDFKAIDKKGSSSKAIRQHQLVDAANPKSLKISFAELPQSAHKLSFTLGIDSLTNVSGAMGGDLDPTKGMYWAWQSGYINLKIEGSSPVCPARKNRFQYHIGGYMPPHSACQTIALEQEGTSSIVEVELAHLLNIKDIAEDFRIMDPGTAGAEFAQSFIHAFSLAK